MRRFSLAIFSVSAIAVAQIASAADLPRKAPAELPPPAPVYSWTGFYAGFNFGGTWSDSSINTSATTLQFITPGGGFVNGLAASAASAQGVTGEFSGANNGPIGGLQFGYNWQFTNWVAGFEADFQGVANKRNQVVGGNTPFNLTLATPGGGCDITLGFCSISTNMTLSKEVDWMGTVRGRLGWLATPSLLVYGTGGLAYGEVKASTNIAQTYPTVLGAVVPNFGGSSSISETRVGWTAGAGFEWMLGPHWSAKAEYLYYDLGSVTYNGPLVSPSDCCGPYFTNTVQTTTRFNGNIARLGLNYHF